MLLAEHVGSRLHVCHLSTAGSVEIIRWAKGRGIDVTAEVTPHHLVLTDELARDYDPTFKVNPPLRTAADVEAVRQGLADGTIDIVATDHAPHTREDKDCEWAAAAFGMTGLETALSVVQQTMVDPGRMTWADVARVLSAAPARIGRIDEGPTAQGRPLEVGEPANVVLVDPAARRVVDGRTQSTASTNTPFHGREPAGPGRRDVPARARDGPGRRTRRAGRGGALVNLPCPSRSASGSSSASCCSRSSSWASSD